MKKLYLFSIFILCYFNASAQKYLPQIKEGTKMTYKVVAYATGQTANINLTIISLKAPVIINWDIPFVGKGIFQMSARSVQSATKTLAEEPQPDEVTQMKDDQTLLILSKDTYNTAVTTKTFQLNGYTFNIQTDTSGIKVNNKELDVFYAVSTKGSRQIWVLNDPAFPLICRSRRVTKYIDFEIVTLTE